MKVLVLIAMVATAMACASERTGPYRAAADLRPPGDVLWLVHLDPVRWIAPKHVPLVPNSKVKYDVESLISGPFFADANIKVIVERQNVLLVGVAPAGVQAEAAETQAWRVTGVAHVINNIQFP